MAVFDKPLFIFEMANNHQGSVEHGKNIISAMREEVKDYMDILAILEKQMKQKNKQP